MFAIGVSPEFRKTPTAPGMPQTLAEVFDFPTRPNISGSCGGHLVEVRVLSSAFSKIKGLQGS
jgi:hypothetical protein